MGEYAFDSKIGERCGSNILANERFGFIATDRGTGHMWHLNSRENRVNRWLNDPYAEIGTERLTCGGESLFGGRVTYCFGYARWETSIGGHSFSVRAFVPMEHDARIMIIETDCDEGELVYYTDLVMSNRDSDSKYVRTWTENGLFCADNPMNSDYRGDVFRAAFSADMKGFTCDRLSFDEGKFDGGTGSGMLACFAVKLGIAPKIVIAVGCTDPDSLKSLTSFETAERLYRETAEYWEKAVCPIEFRTGSPQMDDYLNGWALYQVIACRLMARCSVYQCGGAYGFRDQLQDVTALTASDPRRVRRQIVMAAEHQFEEGDVLHWWHPVPTGDKGVRTRCSDDLLWLPYALCDYAAKTGDLDLCRRSVEYITAPVLSGDERERYCVPTKSGVSESLLRHCVRAAELVIKRGTGDHGLLLMATGDWNDGMNAVGENGRGESVWLTFFASIVLRRLGGLCSELGDTSEGARLTSYADEYLKSAEDAWDGEWFLRGYYDDGTPLGGRGDSECEIDSIAQSFAVFAGADRKKTEKAMDSAYNMLFDRENKVIRLFAPSFDSGGANPGYIKGYAPGFRENGGQYTHAAVWLALAFFRLGDRNRGLELLNAILPANHDHDVYKAEEYVLAGDVSYNKDNIGLAGWSWYTGAAGWFYRTAREVFGV
jgi:cyclic beta-1,2-glucan synthetase